MGYKALPPLGDLVKTKILKWLSYQTIKWRLNCQMKEK